ncbi:MAG: peptidoglycan-binding protein [Oscillospiraceae bacterium]|nr:peptidoglycan-binding protein [Oscillospiraceae bacterium]
MRPPESFTGQPIRSLQTMLRVLSEYSSDYSPVIPDGIYGPETVRSVSVFQRKHGLPVTGVTDLNTWNAIVSEYEPALVAQNEAAAIYAVLNPGQIIRKGERHPNIYLVQAMLTVLAQTYESIALPTFSGILDDLTADSLASFQALNGLPMTGNLDKITWKRLTSHYPLAANLALTSI